MSLSFLSSPHSLLFSPPRHLSARMPSPAFVSLPLLFVFFLFLSPSSANLNPNVDKVCRLTKTYHFCVGALQSDPRSSYADLATVCDISLRISLANFSKVSSEIDDLYSKPANPAMKYCLKSCRDMYANGRIDLARGLADLGKKDFAGVNRDAMEAEAWPHLCETYFKKKGVVSPLVVENQDAYNLCAITEVASRLLNGR